MALQGRGVWLGTRSGHLFLLDAGSVQEGREDCHLGFQHCGEGKVKNIVPLVSSKKISDKFEVHVVHYTFVHESVCVCLCVYMYFPRLRKLLYTTLNLV